MREDEGICLWSQECAILGPKWSFLPDIRESPRNQSPLQKPERKSVMNWDPELGFLGHKAGPCLMGSGALSLLEASPCHDAGGRGGACLKAPPRPGATAWKLCFQQMPQMIFIG